MRLFTARLGRTLLPALALSSIAVLLAVPLMSSRREAPAPPAAATTGTQASSERETYGRIPLSFEANRGQTKPSVDYIARGAGYTLFLKPTEAVFVLRSSDSGARDEDGGVRSFTTDAPRPKADPQSATRSPRSQVLRMGLVGADASAAAEGGDELAGKANYLVGDDPSQWRTGVPTYGRVRYAEVYPGVDVVYYGNQRQLEYDFRVAPGADPGAVGLRFDGADEIDVDANGDLLLKLGGTVVRQPKPFVYQEVAGARREVEADYAVGADGRVGFTLGEYDPAHTLVIDPTLVYSTYLGGSGTEDGIDIQVDSAGNAYVCGHTSSTNFPTAKALQGTFGGATFAGGRDAFITKLNAEGTAFVYSTYLGGGGDDRCNKIAVDSARNAYVAGETTSTNFPTANGVQAAFGGGLSDAYVAKLNDDGSALVYSTYLGGNVFDAASGIALDSSNNVYVTGRTTSANYPTANAIQAAQASANADAFVTKIHNTGSALVYSTYLGGGGGEAFDAGFSIAVDADGAAYVTGQTTSTNFPRANAIQGFFGGGSPDGDAFVTKIAPTGQTLVYSTYLGGEENDIGFEIALDSANNAYVTGVTRSVGFPTVNALRSARAGASDAFLTKFNPAGGFSYSTYLGGGGEDSGNGVVLDADNNVYVAGGTSSTDIPTAVPTQAASGGGIDAFVMQLNFDGSALVYSTYLGGGGGDAALAIALDSSRAMYLTGRTQSTNFPTSRPVQSANGGGQDAFVTKIAPDVPPPSSFQFSQATYTVQEDVTFVTLTVTRTGDTSVGATVDYATADGTATERSDYTTALGTLRFAAAQPDASVTVLISEDSFTEGEQSFTVALSNPTNGGSLGATPTATVRITDDAVEPATNVIDDPVVFVGMHYHDFLNRQADAPGLDFWTAPLVGCGADAACLDRRRTDVSQAFFLSIEFQQTGYFVFRAYRASFADSAVRPRGMPRYREFLRDTQEIGRNVVVNQGNWEQQLEANKQEFLRRWVQRPEFLAEFPMGMSAHAFVNKLFANVGITPTPTDIEIATHSYSDTVQGRATTVRNVVELNSVYNRQFNEGFVLAQYVGYLRRNPNDAPDTDYTGFDFWLAKLNSLSQPGEDVRNEQTALARVNRAEMVRAFILSLEYRRRFGQ